ncbi:MAG: hypothetical protein OEZ23_05560 [Gammaproteobacteria bacterium]|nr:hypothetical protein [Gammaproteobacteria bacterium]
MDFILKYKYWLSLLIVTVLAIMMPAEYENFEEIAIYENPQVLQADINAGISGAEDPFDDDFRAILEDIEGQLHQPNIVKSDIVRGWYLASEQEKKYGTPDTWVFVDDGAKSRWVSSNILDEDSLIDDSRLCRSTAGNYTSSCLETSDEACEYVGESFCKCIEGSRWKDGQGCILITEKGSFEAINSKELEQGWYFGLPNEKKLNTPADWIWHEDGQKSMWRHET